MSISMRTVYSTEAKAHTVNKIHDIFIKGRQPSEWILFTYKSTRHDQYIRDVNKIAEEAWELWLTSNLLQKYLIYS